MFLIQPLMKNDIYSSNMQKCSGGNSRAIRCISAISVALSELPAVTKMSIQRHQPGDLPVISAENMQILQNLRIICIIYCNHQPYPCVSAPVHKSVILPSTIRANHITRETDNWPPCVRRTTPRNATKSPSLISDSIVMLKSGIA